MKLEYLANALVKFNEISLEVKQKHEEIHVEVEMYPLRYYSLEEIPEMIWVKFRKDKSGDWYYKEEL